MSQAETGSSFNIGGKEHQSKMQASTLLGSCIETALPFQSGLSSDTKEVYITPYFRVPRSRSGVSFCLVTETQQQPTDDLPNRTRVGATLLLLPRGIVIDGVGHPTPVIELAGTKNQSGTVECQRVVSYAFGMKPDVLSDLQNSSVVIQSMQNHFKRQASRGRILRAQDGPLCIITFTPMRQGAYLNF